ncbi:MAG: histidine kinase, partial [Burkholderiaceae bacterium]
MNPFRSEPLPRARLLLRRIPYDLAIVSAVNLACAVVVTYVMRDGGSSFWENLVFSMCIGTLAMALINGARILLWGEGVPPKLPFFALVAAGSVLAYVLGHELAMRLLGLPPREFAHGLEENAVGFISLTVLAGLMLTIFFWSRAEVAELKIAAATEKARAAAVERQAMQAQLQLLQAQIEPHMLFNTLATLQSLIGIDAPRAQHMLEQLIHYLRATLSSSRAETTTLAQEFALMDAYLGLMSVRMGARLNYALELPAELRELALPPMLLQPLVENAIKHGLEPKIDGGGIRVEARRDGDRLRLTVADTGLGLDAAGPGHAAVPGG